MAPQMTPLRRGTALERIRPPDFVVTCVPSRFAIISADCDTICFWSSLPATLVAVSSLILLLTSTAIFFMSSRATATWFMTPMKAVSITSPSGVRRSLASSMSG